MRSWESISRLVRDGLYAMFDQHIAVGPCNPVGTWRLCRRGYVPGHGVVGAIAFGYMCSACSSKSAQSGTSACISPKSTVFGVTCAIATLGVNPVLQLCVRCGRCERPSSFLPRCSTRICFSMASLHDFYTTLLRYRHQPRNTDSEPPDV